jgi:NAD(P)-dependent dehydrogenase (short-subunit alcohol dehydrogenase family)
MTEPAEPNAAAATTTTTTPPPCKGTILVTGANGGLGRGYVTAFSRSPYAKDYRGIYLDRDDAAAQELEAFCRTKVQPRCPDHKWEAAALDLGNLARIRAFAGDINARVASGSLEPIRALVLVAGYLDVGPEASKPRRFTEDGHEAVWGINYLANFLLVLLLLRSMDKEHGRVVMVSSWAHNPFDRRNVLTGHLGLPEYKVQYRDTEALAKGVEYPDEGNKAGLRRYGASKACLVMFMCVFPSPILPPK